MTLKSPSGILIHRQKTIDKSSLLHQNYFHLESMGNWFPRISKTTILGLFFLSLLLCLSVTRPSEANMEVQTRGPSVLNIFDSKEELSQSLSKCIADLSEKYEKERGYFTMVLTGDSIIVPMKKLLEPPYNTTIDWSKWYVFWADERFVPKNNPLSNYKFDYEEFLSKVLPIPKDQIITFDDKLPIDEAATDYENRIRSLVQSYVIASPNNVTSFPKFDLMLLGLGPDGHVASLFPNHLQQLNEDKKWVTYITDSPKPPPERLTMTLPVINNSSNIAFVVTGEDMAKTVSRVFDGNPSSTQLPAKLVSPIDGELKWFLDKNATSKLLKT